MKMKDTQQKKFNRIVVGIDGSTSSDATLEWAANQAKLTGSNLEVLNTWERSASYGRAVPIPSDSDPRSEATNQVDRVVKGVRAKFAGVPIHTHVVEGHPAPTLVEASHESDLLVVGSGGQGECSGMLLGSVSDYVAHHARCPVVIIR
jgi:nucleotide-binding universal stress UspA family protein